MPLDPTTRRPTFLEDVPETREARPMAMLAARAAPPSRAEGALLRPAFGAAPSRKSPRELLELAAQARLAELEAAGAAHEAALSQTQQGAQQQLATALEALRRHGVLLAEEARAASIDIAFLVARRILETELHSGPEAFLSLVRSAVRRVGEANRITLRVCPQDVPALEAPLGHELVAAATMAQIDIVPDTSLRPGDCLVDSESAHVDGRLETRLGELRSALDDDDASASRPGAGSTGEVA